MTATQNAAARRATLILAGNVKRLRAAAGMSQRSLARSAGVSQAMVTFVENAYPDRETSLRTVQKLAAALGTTVRVLLTETDCPQCGEATAGISALAGRVAS